MRKTKRKIKTLSGVRKLRVKLGVRKKVIGTPEIPRVCFKKTNKNFTALVVDDSSSKILFSLNTFGKNVSKPITANRDGAEEFSNLVSSMMKEKGITKAVFDRDGSRYGLIVSKFADGLRSNGIKI